MTFMKFAQKTKISSRSEKFSLIQKAKAKIVQKISKKSLNMKRIRFQSKSQNLLTPSKKLQKQNSSLCSIQSRFQQKYLQKNILLKIFSKKIKLKRSLPKRSHQLKFQTKYLFSQRKMSRNGIQTNFSAMKMKKLEKTKVA